MLVQPPSSAGSGITTEKLLAAPASNGAVFRMIKAQNDRMAGSVPSWGPPQTPQEEVTQALAATSSRLSPDTSMALSLSAEQAEKKPEESFGFFDLIDMVNPLQHIPIVGTLYRALTGDEIKPIAQIVGGAVFGGAIGAAGGIANAIVQSETGKDIGDNALSFIRGEHNSPKSNDTTIAVASLAYKQPRYNE